MPVRRYRPSLGFSLLFDVVALAGVDFPFASTDYSGDQRVEVHGDVVFQYVGTDHHRFERRGSPNDAGSAACCSRICDGPVVSSSADISTSWLQHDDALIAG